MLLFREHEVKIKFRGRLAGGIPKHDETIAAWLEAKSRNMVKAGFSKSEVEAKIGELEGELTIKKIEEMSENEELKVSSGFLQDEGGFYLPGYYVKSMLREAAATLRTAGSLPRVGFKQTLQCGVDILTDKIYIGKKVDGTEEKVGHPTLPDGRKTSILKRFDYFEGGTITSFKIEVMDNQHGRIFEAVLDDLLIISERIGLGAGRSQKYGQFYVVSWKAPNGKVIESKNGESIFLNDRTCLEKIRKELELPNPPKAKAKKKEADKKE